MQVLNLFSPSEVGKVAQTYKVVGKPSSTPRGTGAEKGETSKVVRRSSNHLGF